MSVKSLLSRLAEEKDQNRVVARGFDRAEAAKPVNEGDEVIVEFVEAENVSIATMVRCVNAAFGRFGDVECVLTSTQDVIEDLDDDFFDDLLWFEEEEEEVVPCGGTCGNLDQVGVLEWVTYVLDTEGNIDSEELAQNTKYTLNQVDDFLTGNVDLTHEFLEAVDEYIDDNTSGDRIAPRLANLLA